MTTITRRSTVTASSDQVSCDLDGEAAILNLRSGVYYGLDRVGAWIWGLIQTPRTVDEIAAAMLEAYDVDAERAERDLLSLLQDMEDGGLVEIRDAAIP
jgi:hypothetical protein